MKLKIIAYLRDSLLLAVSLTGVCASAADYIPVDSKKSYLDFDLSKGPILLEGLASKTKVRSVIFQLNSEGLQVREKPVCSWPKGRFDSKNSASMVLTKTGSEEACNSFPALRSTWGDGGTGTAVLTLEISKVESDSATTTFENQPVSVSLKALSGKYKLRAPGTLTNTVGD